MLKLLLVIIIGLMLTSCNLKSAKTTSTPTPTPSLAIIDEKVEITASFIIMTDSITRSFKAEKYHNQSPDVYIEAYDPTKVHVTKSGITWDDFAKTLPMKLTKDCLTTGDGETFCDGKDGILKFYLNDVEDKNLLDREIKEADQALIKFTSLPY